MKKYYFAAIIAGLYIPVITIVAELNKPLKDFIAATFWHHWLGKSVILVGIMVILSLLPIRSKETTVKEDVGFLTLLMGITVLGGLSILGFFTYEYFTHLA